MAVNLVTIPNVELVEVGDWDASTGPFHCTKEMLAAAVAAADDPAVRTPVVKLGHQNNPKWDGDPAVGRIENLHLDETGMVLLGDLVGVPKWLAEIMKSAYPSRSIEAVGNVTTASGGKHEFVITGLALLGVALPAIESLADLADLYDADAVAAAGFTAGDALTLKGGPMHVAASVNIDTVRSEFYENLPSGSWAWIREVWSDFLIADNDEGDLYRIPWTEDADGDVTFGPPVEVAVQYVPTTDDESDDTTLMLSRAPVDGPRLHPDTASVTASTTPQPTSGGHEMEMAEVLTKFGLPADATEAQIDAHVVEYLKTLDEATAPKPDASELPDGVVAIDKATLDDLKVAAGRGVAADERIRTDDRDRFIGDAIRAGKFPPARKDHWAGLFDKDPEGTREFIDKLAAGAVPLTEIGNGANTESASSDDAIWTELYGSDPRFTTEGA